MALMSGKRALLELLKQEGVEVLFGNPGTTELPLMDALAVENQLRYVLALQEGAAMAMADGYAQASGKLVMVNLHVAPGLGNAMGMLYDAQKSGAPILVTAGQHDHGFDVTEPILSADLPRIARPLVKWAGEVHRLADLPRILHRAAKTALAPPTGPVFLSIPADILNANGEVDLMAPTRVGKQLRGDREAIEKAADLLAQSERPLLISGDAVAQSKAHTELIELAELIGAPVFAEAVANTASFPTSHPLYHGAIMRVGSWIAERLAQHDVLFSVGGDLFTLSLPPTVELVPKHLRIIHLDVDPWELGKNFPADVAILGDPKATLPELTAAIRARLTDSMRLRAQERFGRMISSISSYRESLLAKAAADAAIIPIQAFSLLQAIGAVVPKDSIVVEEAISSSPGIRDLIKSDDPQSFFGLRGGGIGWGLPAAIGVKIALPNRPVIALIGDGSAMYTCQALWTAAHERAGVIFVILNNKSYRILKQRVHTLRGHAAQTDIYVGMDLLDPQIDFVGLARCFGIAAERTSTIADTIDALKKALVNGQPMLIDVTMDRAFKPLT